MTKKEIAEWTNIAMSAEAKVISTNDIEFSYNNGTFEMKFTVHSCDIDEARKSFLDYLLKSARRNETKKSIPKRELDAASIRSQNYLLWWKGNIDKTDTVRETYSMLLAFDEKWRDIQWHDLTEEQMKKRREDYHLIKMAYKKLQINGEYEFRCIANRRECVPTAWERA